MTSAIFPNEGILGFLGVLGVNLKGAIKGFFLVIKGP